MLLAVYQASETNSNVKALFALLNVPGDLEYVTWKLSTWLLDLAHILVDTFARIARQERYSGTKTHVTGNSDEFRAPTFGEKYFRKEDWEQVFFLLPKSPFV